MSASPSIISSLCVIVLAFSVVNADGQINALAEMYGTCGVTVMKCVQPLMDLEQYAQSIGGFNVTVFKEQCGLYPSMLECVEREIQACNLPMKMVQSALSGIREALDYICREKQADFVEMAPCLQSQDVVMAVNGCVVAMQQHLLSSVMSMMSPSASDMSQSSLSDRMSQMCNLYNEFIDCVAMTVTVCGAKAADIFHTLGTRLFNRILEMFGQKCSFKMSKKLNTASIVKKANVDTGYIVGGCALVFLVLMILVVAFVRIRRNRHQSLTRRHLISGEEPPAYEDVLPANK